VKLHLYSPHTPSWRIQGQQYFFFYFQPTGDRQNAEDMTGLMKVVRSPCKQSSCDSLEHENRDGSGTKTFIYAGELCKVQQTNKFVANINLAEQKR
jgi:hypothetical protein